MNKILRTRIAQRIIAARKELSVSQAKLARASGVSLASIKKIEAGDMNFSVDLLHKLAQALGVEIKELL